MNYHFTTTKAHFNLMGATVLELFGPEALNTAEQLSRSRATWTWGG